MNRGRATSPHFTSVAAMIGEDFGPSRAREGPKDRRGRGQRSLQSVKPWRFPQPFNMQGVWSWPQAAGEKCGLAGLRPRLLAGWGGLK